MENYEKTLRNLCTHRKKLLFESLSTNGNAGYIANMAQLSAHLKNASNFSFFSENDQNPSNNS